MKFFVFCLVVAMATAIPQGRFGGGSSFGSFMGKSAGGSAAGSVGGTPGDSVGSTPGGSVGSTPGGSVGGTPVSSAGGSLGGFAGGLRAAQPNYGPKAYGQGLNNPFAFPPNPFKMQSALALAERIPNLLVRVDANGDVELTDRFGKEVDGVYDSFGRDITEIYDI